MDRQTHSHHSLPSRLVDFAKQIPTSGNANRFAARGRRRSAREHFLEQVEGQQVKLRTISLPMRDLPNEVLPVLYFTRSECQPVTIVARSGREFSVRMWDGREMVCDFRRLERLLAPGGYFISSKTGLGNIDWGTQRELVNELRAEKSHLGLGVASGVISGSILAGFSLVLFETLESTFSNPELTTPSFAIIGLIASVLLVMGFLQIRELVHRWLAGLSVDLRLREQGMPQPEVIRKLGGVDTSRGLVELLLAPLFLAVGICMVVMAPLSVATWAAMIGCLVPTFVVCSAAPKMHELWTEAVWLIKGRNETAVTPEIAPVGSGRETAQPLAVTTRNLFLAHPDGVSTPLIDGVSLQVAAGEKLGVISENNADVAVFLRVVSGLLAFDCGEVRIHGRCSRRQDSKDLGWFSSRASLVDGTVRDNLVADWPNDEPSDDLIVEAMAITKLDLCPQKGLDEWISEKGSCLSAERKMRLQFTRTLIQQPKMLILDSLVDSSCEQELETILQRYLAQKPDCTVLVGGRRGALMTTLTNRLVELKDGRVVADSVVSRLSDQQSEVDSSKKGLY